MIFRMSGKMKYNISDENGTFKVADFQDVDLSMKDLEEIDEKYGDTKILVDFGHYIRARHLHFQCSGVLSNTRDENEWLVSILEKFANGDNAGATSDYEKFKKKKKDQDEEFEKELVEARAGRLSCFRKKHGLSII